MNKYNKINEEIITIDSMSIWLKREEVTIIDKRLTSEIIYGYPALNKWDDEIHPPKPIIIEKGDRDWETVYYF